jgi:nicotinate-nucleotide pyrophosphorylase (carboxylating)
MDVEALAEIVRRALAEDRADDDVTTLATVPPDASGVGRLLAKEACVLGGTEAFIATFEAVGDLFVTIEPDGTAVIPEMSVATVTGPLRPILTAERTALNFVQQLSGVATLTRAFVDAAPNVEIRDTRKTTPGLRALEKRAVRAGGGVNHRTDLSAAILIKDNHIAACGSMEAAIAAARETGRWVEVECETLGQVRAAVEAGADEILLDNMSVPELSEAVRLIAGRARTEASGGVTLDTVAAIAKTGVDAISVGALTHSARAVDLSLEIERTG